MHKEHKNTQQLPDGCKKCDICGLVSNCTEDVIPFGDWMQRQDITVHYFCLLLSTNLPQLGGDKAGILGFQVRDIRAEIRSARERECCYCHEMGASVACHKCKTYFHVICGHGVNCLFEFIGEFRSYCHECVPLDELQLRFKQKPPERTKCYICLEDMLTYKPVTWIHARCCGNGFVHRSCMRKYALAAGYYLSCIWCRSKDFRDHVRYQGVFVPDRDAKWEEKNAYAELHRGHRRCDMENCKCPKGRNFESGKWSLIVCSLCGSFGAHNPGCITDSGSKAGKVEDFKCKTCRQTMDSVSNRNVSDGDDDLNSGVYLGLHMSKIRPKDECPFSPENSESGAPSFASSVTTVRFRMPAEPMEIEDSPREVANEARQLGTPNENADVIDLCSTVSTESEKTVVFHTSQHLSECDNIVHSPSAGNLNLNNGAAGSILASQQTATEEPAGEGNLGTANGNGSPCNDSVGVGGTRVKNLSADREKSILIIDDWPEFDEEFNCVGVATLQIDRNSPRFAGRSLEDICWHHRHLISNADKIGCSNELGVWAIVNKVIAEYDEE